MNHPRFHCPLPLVAGARFDLPERAAHHASAVLRLRCNDELTLFDGSGGEYRARVVANDRRRVTVELSDWSAVERESRLSVTLVQAVQAGDKMDLTIQKAVELGVARIVPVLSRRSVARPAGERAWRRLQHWQAVIVSACEQCGRNRLPELAPIESLDSWLARPPLAAALRLMLAADAAWSLAAAPAMSVGQPVELLIGAEGGLAAEELRLATLSGFLPVRLGPRILRTETAGFAALAALQALWGDFKEERTDV